MSPNIEWFAGPEPQRFVPNGDISDLWDESLPTEEGVYLTISFMAGRYAHPRLVLVWKGPKSGNLYCKTMGHDMSRRRVEKVFGPGLFGLQWIKVKDPDGDEDYWLGGEWFRKPPKEE